MRSSLAVENFEATPKTGSRAKRVIQQYSTKNFCFTCGKSSLLIATLNKKDKDA